MTGSAAEALLVHQITAAGLPTPVRELRFAPPRRWRFDVAWPERLLAVEVDGGSWVGGRHTRGAGYEAGCRKTNAAVLLGWRVLRVTPGMIASGEAVAVIGAALATVAGGEEET